MKSCTKKWLLAAAALVAAGVLLVAVSFAAVGFDWTKLSTQKFVSSSYELTESFERISIDVETASVTFAPSEDGVCRVECYEEEQVRHFVGIQDGTLFINAVDNRKWFDHIGITFQTPTVTVYLPKDAYTSLSVKTVTGNIEISDRYCFQTVAIDGVTSDITCYASVLQSMEIHVTTGDIVIGGSDPMILWLSATTGEMSVNDVNCHRLIAESSTGEICLNRVIAAESISVESDTGDVSFELCDAESIEVHTDTGNVKGTLLSEKIFITETSAGRVQVPQTTSGGKCKIETSTGDIHMGIAS